MQQVISSPEETAEPKVGNNLGNNLGYKIGNRTGEESVHLEHLDVHSNC